jgi:hypothetical protein
MIDRSAKRYADLAAIERPEPRQVTNALAQYNCALVRWGDVVEAAAYVRPDGRVVCALYKAVRFWLVPARDVAPHAPNLTAEAYYEMIKSFTGYRQYGRSIGKSTLIAQSTLYGPTRLQFYAAVALVHGCAWLVDVRDPAEAANDGAWVPKWLTYALQRRPDRVDELLHPDKATALSHWEAVKDSEPKHREAFLTAVTVTDIMNLGSAL